MATFNDTKIVSPINAVQMRFSAVRALQAVMWLVSGDERYAANAAGIIDAWATTNKRFCGKNAPLVSSACKSAFLLVPCACAAITLAQLPFFGHAGGWLGHCQLCTRR